MSVEDVKSTLQNTYCQSVLAYRDAITLYKGKNSLADIRKAVESAGAKLIANSEPLSLQTIIAEPRIIPKLPEIGDATLASLRMHGVSTNADIITKSGFAMYSHANSVLNLKNLTSLQSIGPGRAATLIKWCEESLTPAERVNLYMLAFNEYRRRHDVLIKEEANRKLIPLRQIAVIIVMLILAFLISSTFGV